jgi:nucleoside-diphosphate-sugar epimerase
MKVLVTGSSGFIGEHLVQRLTREGHTVGGLDVTPPSTEPANFTFQIGSLVDGPKLTAITSSFAPQTIVHLAARTDLDGKDLQDYAANIGGVENLLTAIRKTPSVTRCIFTSSQLVCKAGYIPKHEQDYRPNTLYGQSKVMTEQAVRYADGGGVEWCLVRPTTVWGPGMNRHYQSFFRLIRRGRYFHIGHRPLYKTYGFVRNVVQQYLRLLEVPARLIHRRVFYVGDYEPLSLREWANAFQREFDAKPIPTLPEALAKLLAKLGDAINAAGYHSFPFNSFRLNNILTEYQYDMSETRAVCGELCANVEQGVKETATWFMHVDRRVTNS